jgi:hypothetical protein
LAKSYHFCRRPVCDWSTMPGNLIVDETQTKLTTIILIMS